MPKQWAFFPTRKNKEVVGKSDHNIVQLDIRQRTESKQIMDLWYTGFFKKSFSHEAIKDLPNFPIFRVTDIKAAK